MDGIILSCFADEAVVSKVNILYHKGHKGNSQRSQRFEYQYFQFSVLCAFLVFFAVKLTFDTISINNANKKADEAHKEISKKNEIGILHNFI